MNIFYCGMSPLSSRVLYTSLLYIPTYIKSFLTIIIAILLICRTCRHYYKIYNGYKVNFNYSSLLYIVWPTIPQKKSQYHFTYSLAPNEGRNNWCHSRLWDFDFETFETFLDFETKKQVVPWHQWHHPVRRHCIFVILCQMI